MATFSRTLEHTLRRALSLAGITDSTPNPVGGTFLKDAQGVLTGRATLYGALAGGEAGARRALEILTDELTRAMRLSGVPDLSQVQADLLVP